MAIGRKGFKFIMIALLAVIVIFSTCASVYASESGNIITKFGSEYDGMLQQSTESSWAAMKPLINLLIYGIVVIGIILILGSIAYVVFNGLKTVTGKQGFTKEVFRNFLVSMVIGVLVTTSGWVGILNFTQTVVNSGVNVINEAQETGASAGGNGSTITD